jgi:hypothetical protein
MTDQSVIVTSSQAPIDAIVLLALMLLAMTIAVTRFRRTLD